VVTHGVLRLPPRPLSVRLSVLFGELQSLIAAHRPAVLSIEQVFHGKNFQSVLKVGEARGVVVLAAQLGGLEIHEYSPATIKKVATGNGNARKLQVARMMGRLLGLETIPWPHDVTDALAAAFCHAQRAVPQAFPAPRPLAPAGAALLAVTRGRRRRASGAARQAVSGFDLESLIRSGKARLLARKKRLRPRSGAASGPGKTTSTMESQP